jgi:hypothetical protein
MGRAGERGSRVQCLLSKLLSPKFKSQFYQFKPQYHWKKKELPQIYLFPAYMT